MNKSNKFLSVIVAVFMAAVMFMPFSASAESNYMGVVVGINENNEVIGQVAAVTLKNSGNKVLLFDSSAFENYDVSEYYLQTASGQYEIIQNQGTYYVNTDADDSAFLELGSPVEGEDAYLAYLKSDGSQNISNVVVESVTSADNSLNLTISGVPSDVLVYAAVLNSKAQCIGILYSSNKAVNVWSQSSGTGGTGETGGTGSGSSSGSLKNDVLSGAAIGVAAAAAVGIIRAFRKSKNSGDNSKPSNQNENDVFVTDDIYPSKPNFEEEVFTDNDDMFITDDEIGKTENITPNSRTISLLGIGGQMDGRRYYFNGSEILIGRATESNIRYSPETKGVSRIHCKLFFHGDKLMLMDLGSSFGTSIDGYGKLTPQVPMEVSKGTCFCVGDIRNKFRVE